MSDSLFLLLSTIGLVMLVFVDKVLIIGKALEVERMVKTLGKVFSISNVGKPTHFLGVKIDFRSNGIFLSESADTKKVI